MNLAPCETWQNPGFFIGSEVRRYNELPSTNDLAAELAHDPANRGLAIVADHQTAGRGQHDRVWQAEPASSLLLSLILPPHPALLRPAILTAWAAVGMAEAIGSLSGAEARMKWPNDLLVKCRKICGILIEMGRGIVVGIGLNLNQSSGHFTDAGLTEATSLFGIAGRTFELRPVLDCVLLHLDVGFKRLVGGDRESLERAWVERLGLVGRTVETVRTDGTTIVGTLAEMNFDALMIVQFHGEPISLPPEAIRHLRAA